MSAETVGLLSHPRGGLHMLREFGQFVAAFEPEAVGDSGDPVDPVDPVDPLELEVVSGYLESESIDPVVFEVVAGAAPAAATRVFRRLLGSDTFDWPHDGEALMRHHKPPFFARERLPYIIGLNAELAEGLQALERAERAERGDGGKQWR